MNITEFHYTKNKHMKHKLRQNSVRFTRLHSEITKSLLLLLLLNLTHFRLLNLFLFLKMNFVPLAYSRSPPPSSYPLVCILGPVFQYVLLNL
jgi:hypothetical protein